MIMTGTAYGGRGKKERGPTATGEKGIKGGGKRALPATWNMSLGRRRRNRKGSGWWGGTMNPAEKAPE